MAKRREMGKGEREEMLDRKRGERKREERGEEKTKRERVRGVREQGGDKQPLLKYAAIFSVVR